MQIEAYLTMTNIATTECSQQDWLPSNAIVGKSTPDEKLVTIINNLSDMVEWLEVTVRGPHLQHSYTNRSQRPPHFQRNPQPVICFNCQQPGHLARGCVAPCQPKRVASSRK